MGLLNPLGRNWGDLVNWDALGKFYASFAIVWTVILYAGAIWLYMHRNVPYLKMRNIPLAITAISFLHIYLVKIMLAYTTNGHFPCSGEFWIMSIYLPFGIAFFQANLSQLLSISTQQRRLLQGGRTMMRDPRVGKWNARGLWARWKGLTQLKKTYVCIGIGMFFQVVTTAAIYGTNTKLQGHWGKLTYAKGQAACRKGVEWVPSAMWQLFFCCIYGPYLLYSLRNVRDTHFWRLQVMCSVIAGFPGAPLWLASVFSPAFKPVNKWFVPPMWLAPGIIVMQAVTIFMPIYEHQLTLRLSSRTLSMLNTLTTSTADKEKWDATTAKDSSSRSTSSHPAPPSSSNISYHANAEMYTLSALEKALNQNPGPLLTFAATKDFTAESIIFLIAVRNFRAQSKIVGTTKEQLWPQARDIYIQSVSERSAEFPINIDGSVRGRLDRIFGSSVGSDVSGNGGVKQVGSGKAGWEWEETEQEQRDKISPFANVSATDVPLSPMKGGNWGFIDGAYQYPLTPATSNFPATPSTLNNSEDGNDRDYVGELHEMPRTTSMEELNVQGEGELDGEIESVFDVAERSIKYLVVTNTWRKFVTESREEAKKSLEIMA